MNLAFVRLNLALTWAAGALGLFLELGPFNNEAPGIVDIVQTGSFLARGVHEPFLELFFFRPWPLMNLALFGASGAASEKRARLSLPPNASY